MNFPARYMSICTWVFGGVKTVRLRGYTCEVGEKLHTISAVRVNIDVPKFYTVIIARLL